MKVLWIKSDFPLPADTGGKIRTLNLLSALAKLCNVTFLSYVPPELDGKWINQLRGFGIKIESVLQPEENKEGFAFKLRVLSKLLSSRPYIVNKYITEEMAQRIRKVATEQQIDVVVCDFLEMAWCADHLGGIPKVLFEHNVETLIWRRYHEVEKSFLKKLYFAYEKKRLERFERDSCARFDQVLTVSDQDGELLRKEFGLRRYVTIPTGVDTGFFHPLGREINHRLVFCGSMDWMPNIDGFWWFYRDILPIIRQETADVSFAVVGRRPAVDIVKTGKDDKSIIITGTVADVRPEVAAGQIYVVPLRVGGGTRIKIYEALAMRKCVVSTTIGAEGLPLTNGVNIVLADDENEFAKKVTELLRDDNKRNKIAEAGFRLVTEKYSWSKAAEKMYGTLKTAADTRDDSKARNRG
jgi:polysaccharide biosynthesis protein PslH